MIVVRDNLWLCTDCTIAAVHGDVPTDAHENDVMAIIAGLAELGDDLVPDWDTDTDTGEILEGFREFSNCGCDCCSSGLAGSFHRFAILGTDEGAQMNRWKLTFTGRETKAIGIFYPCEIIVEAATEADAKIKLYETHDMGGDHRLRIERIES